MATDHHDREESCADQAGGRVGGRRAPPFAGQKIIYTNKVGRREGGRGGEVAGGTRRGCCACLIVLGFQVT